MENILNYEFLKQFAVAGAAGCFIGLLVWTAGQIICYTVRGIILIIRKRKNKEEHDHE